MILHSDYTAETDKLRVIRDQLETQETVETLHKSTGQVIDAYDGVAQTLAAAWPAYSAGYYDTLRVLSKGTAAASQWRTFTSALPVPVTAPDAPVQPDTEQVADASTTAVAFDINAEIQRLLTDLGNI